MDIATLIIIATIYTGAGSSVAIDTVGFSSMEKCQNAREYLLIEAKPTDQRMEEGFRKSAAEDYWRYDPMPGTINATCSLN